MNALLNMFRGAVIHPRTWDCWGVVAMGGGARLVVLAMCGVCVGWFGYQCRGAMATATYM